MHGFPRLVSILIALLSISPAVVAEEEDDAELARALERIPPTPASEAKSTFRLHPDFVIELVASEPDVIDPVDMAFDESGRAFVVEMRDYPFTLEEGNMTRSDEAKKQPNGRIRLLEDTDGDGSFDRSRVFVDDLHWPTGVACYKGGVVIAQAPVILYAADRDGDGKADEKRVLFEGFGTRNVQALVNGLEWGPDVRLWALNGGNGGTITSPDHPQAEPVDIRSRDFRFRPGEMLQTVAGSGGQFGMCFDGFGRRFVCSNSHHLRQVVIDGTALDHNPWFGGGEPAATIAIDGGAAPVFRASPPEPWRLVRTRWRAESKDASRYPPTELVPVGFFTSATGLLVYRGHAYGEEWRNTVFVGDVGGNLVHRKTLRDDGAAFAGVRAQGEEQVEFLTSSDNWFRPVKLLEGPDGLVYILDMYRETIEHPYSVPERIKRHLSLTSGNDRGRIWRLRRRDHPPKPRARFPDDDTSLARLIDSPDGFTRTTAARLLVERDAKDAASVLRETLRSGKHAEGRRAAIGALAALDALDADDLRRALADPEPGVVEGALFHGSDAHRIDDAIDEILALAKHPSARVRLHAALALGRSKDARVPDALATIALQDASDRWIRTAILAADPSHAGPTLARIARWNAPESGVGRLVAELASIAGAAGDRDGAAAAFEAFAGGTSSATLRRDFLAGWSRGLRRRGSSLADAILATDDALSRGARAFLASAREEADDAARSPEERASALRLLAFDPTGEALAVLARALAPDRSPSEQRASLAALTERDGAENAEPVLAAWPSLSPALRQSAAEALFRETARLELVIAAIEREELSVADLEPRRRDELVRGVGGALRERARKLVSKTTRSDRASVVESHQDVLDLEGVSTRGRDVFDRACKTCHRAEGKGHSVGPDLETVQGRSPADLLLHILDPNREVQPIYTAYTAILKDSRVLSGIIASESSASVTLRRADGIDEVVLRSELLELRSTGVSLMPEDLERTISRQELSDLLAYIRALSPAASP